MGIPEFYDPVVNLVRAQGYEIKGLHLPSVNPNTGLVDREPSTMYDDAAFVSFPRHCPISAYFAATYAYRLQMTNVDFIPLASN